MKYLIRRLYFVGKESYHRKTFYSVLIAKQRRIILHKVLLHTAVFQRKKTSLKQFYPNENDILSLNKICLSYTLCRKESMRFSLVPCLIKSKKILTHSFVFNKNAYYRISKGNLSQFMKRNCLFFSNVWKTSEHSSQLFGLLAGCCFSKSIDACETSALITERHVNSPELLEELASISNRESILVGRLNVLPLSSDTSTNVLSQSPSHICKMVRKSGEDPDHLIHTNEVNHPDHEICANEVNHPDCVIHTNEVNRVIKIPHHELSGVKKSRLQKQDAKEGYSLKILCEPNALEQNEEQHTLVKRQCLAIPDLPSTDLQESGEIYLNQKSKNDVCYGEEHEVKQKKRPNYFISLRVSNSKIHESLQEVQDYISQQDVRLKPVMIPLPTLYITLMVFHLSNYDEFERAVEVLKKAHQVFNEDLSKNPLKLEFEGLGNFRHNVLFAKIKSGDSYNRLVKLSQDVHKWFEEASIFSTDTKKEFNAHLTIMKLGRSPQLYRKGIKKINPLLYSKYKDQVFGTELISSIEILKMSGPKDASGYYSGVHFSFDVSSEDDLMRSCTPNPSPSKCLVKELQDSKDQITSFTQKQMEKLLLGK